jgi:hypothetical protein
LAAYFSGNAPNSNISRSKGRAFQWAMANGSIPPTTCFFLPAKGHAVAQVGQVGERDVPFFSEVGQVAHFWEEGNHWPGRRAAGGGVGRRATFVPLCHVARTPIWHKRVAGLNSLQNLVKRSAG